MRPPYHPNSLHQLQNFATRLAILAAFSSCGKPQEYDAREQNSNSPIEIPQPGQSCSILDIRWGKLDVADSMQLPLQILSDLTITLSPACSDLVATQYGPLSTTNNALTYRIPVQLNCQAQDYFSPHFYNYGSYHLGTEGQPQVTVTFPQVVRDITKYWPKQMNNVPARCSVVTLGVQASASINILYTLP